jgi:hypothetical protein
MGHWSRKGYLVWTRKLKGQKTKHGETRLSSVKAKCPCNWIPKPLAAKRIVPHVSFNYWTSPLDIPEVGERVLCLILRLQRSVFSSLSPLDRSSLRLLIEMNIITVCTVMVSWEDAGYFALQHDSRGLEEKICGWWALYCLKGVFLWRGRIGWCLSSWCSWIGPLGKLLKLRRSGEVSVVGNVYPVTET